MKWIDEKLHPGEKVIFLTRPHWSIFSRSFSAFVISLFYWWFALPAIALLLYDLVVFLSHQYVVTNRRLIKKMGFYYIRIKDWPLYKIEDVIFTKTVTDRLQGTGSVILMGIAIPKSYLRSVDNPQKLRNAIYSQLPAR